MGHYFAEVRSEEDNNFSEKYIGYKLKRAREISDIIEKNKIKNEDIKIGDKLKLYSPLLKKSKFRFNNFGDFSQIREFFSMGTNWYSPEMSSLSCVDEFMVYEKRLIKNNLINKVGHQIRIHPKRGLDLFPSWINIKYFSKE